MLKTAVIGHPVAHSRSPIIHGHWLAAHGIAGTYDKIDVAPEALEAFVAGLRGGDFRGVNVTVPHKQAVMPFLDSIDDAARAIGAVNTIICEPDGTLLGSNTDAYGFMEWLTYSSTLRLQRHEVRGGLGAGGRPPINTLVLGAGGAARAVMYGLKQSGITHIHIANRTLQSAQALGKEFGCEIIAWESKDSALADMSLLVNTTSLGMQGKPPLDISLAALPATATVYDIVYAPLETELLAAARAKGCYTVDGLGMLLYQAQKAFECWWGVLPEVTTELKQKVLK